MKLETYIDKYEDAQEAYLKKMDKEQINNLLKWEERLRRKLMFNPKHPLANYQIGPSPRIYYTELILTLPKHMQIADKLVISGTV